jgi:hypothetical protein
MSRRSTWLLPVLLLGTPPLLASCSSTSAVRVANCERAEVKPQRIVLACGDGAAIARDLVWTRWNSNEAAASGTVSQDNCTPDCASGKFIDYPARLKLSETVRVANTSYFTRVTISYLGQSPFGRSVEVRKVCWDTPPSATLPPCPADLRDAG